MGRVGCDPRNLCHGLDLLIPQSGADKGTNCRHQGRNVLFRSGLNGEVFVKLPDGSYNPPPGNPARLIKNVDTTYTYETLNRDKLNFNAAGKIATYNHASGLQVKFTYTGNDLTQVQNSLGPTLTLTNVSGRITAVGDGTRSIG